MTNEVYTERFLRLNDVLRRTGLSRSYIYKSVDDGSFPSPRKVGATATVWLESEKNQWMQSVAGAKGFSECAPTLSSDPTNFADTRT